MYSSVYFDRIRLEYKYINANEVNINTIDEILKQKILRRTALQFESENKIKLKLIQKRWKSQ